MDRFLSTIINKVDKKGRVSIPAVYRPILGATNRLYTRLSARHPCVDAGSSELLVREEQQLAGMDLFSEEYDVYSLVLHAEASEMKIDGEGRVLLSDDIRLQTGIADEVVFVGRGHFFQLWEPKAFRAYRDEARRRVMELRRGSIGGAGDKAVQQEE